MRVSGPVKFGSRTKELVRRLEPGDVAIIDHEDIDELAARALIDCRVVAVVNLADSLTGRYPCPGPGMLLDANITVIDRVDRTVLDHLGHRDVRCSVESDEVVVAGNRFRGRRLTLEVVQRILAQKRQDMEYELARFVENTLDYARREAHEILQSPVLPELRTRLRGRHVLVVVRGRTYREDLGAIRGYIEEFRPVLIGVDGGADALLDLGWKPDIIIGDMDSVSDAALRSGAELVVHAYADGSAPGRSRLEQLRLHHVTMAVPGTSEDAALLLGYERGAELIVAVGTHSSAVDFFEKGRAGMASTLLVRLKVGPRLVDAKGVSQLYRRRFRRRYLAALALGVLIPLGALVAVVSPLQLLLRLIVLKIRMWTGW